MEKKIEKQSFLISEFREEAAWLSFMHRQGWKFISTNGKKYEFEQCEPEDWIYQLDFRKTVLRKRIISRCSPTMAGNIPFITESGFISVK
jgi:hypothetical protein